MYVNWKALFSLGFAFWGVLCATDLLGESAWKKCSSHLEDILKGQYRDMVKIHPESKTTESADNLRQKMNWPMLLWNICAFLCSLLFCSVIKSMSWFIWRLFKIYNVFRNRKVIANKIICSKAVEPKATQELPPEAKSNCKILFKNQMFIGSRQHHDLLTKEMDELKREKSDLSQQLLMAQKENMTARQHIEEYKLENFMMKEKLARTTNTLKENLKYKDFANANQEIISRKAYTLEMHLKEVSRDRDLLRSKLSNIEKNYSKLEERIKVYEKQDSETNQEFFPEKDVPHTPKKETDGIVMDISENLGEKEKWEKPTRMDFEANSKISVDLEESSKENEPESMQDSTGDVKNAYINAIKQNIMNYSAYKVAKRAGNIPKREFIEKCHFQAQMLKPRFKLSSIRHRLYVGTDTGSSSDDNSNSCHRIISSTAEFQNFLKTLTSKSADSITFSKNFY